VPADPSFPIPAALAQLTHADPLRPVDTPRQAVAVDGKTLRGSGHHGQQQVHLLAAMDHTTRTVLGQSDVDTKTNEIARFQPLLEGLDLAGRVLTADAMHTTVAPRSATCRSPRSRVWTSPTPPRWSGSPAVSGRLPATSGGP
jgi:Transposase DDE domain